MSKRITKTSDNYKKTVKFLKRVNSSLSGRELSRPKQYNYYVSLFIEERDHEEEERDHEEEEMYKLIDKKEVTKVSFNDLPVDTINNILEYLPFNTRLAILKHKFNKNCIKDVIKQVPESIEGLHKLWKCADIAVQLLKIVLSERSNVYMSFTPGSISGFKREKNPEKYSKYYKENFTKIIIATLKHYSKIYKEESIKQKIKKIIVLYGMQIEYIITLTSEEVKPNSKTKEHIEQIMLHIFAHLASMK
jgi:hypothetical protein